MGIRSLTGRFIVFFSGDTEGTQEDTLKFELKVKCSWNPERKKDSTHPQDLYRDFCGNIQLLFIVTSFGKYCNFLVMFYSV